MVWAVEALAPCWLLVVQESLEDFCGLSRAGFCAQPCHLKRKVRPFKSKVHGNFLDDEVG